MKIGARSKDLKLKIAKEQDLKIRTINKTRMTIRELGTKIEEADNKEDKKKTKKRRRKKITEIYRIISLF
jgi:hypothetical protein